MKIRISAHRHLKYSPELNHNHSFEAEPFHRARIVEVSEHTKIEALGDLLAGLKAEAVDLADWVESKHPVPTAFGVFLEPLEYSYFSHSIPSLRVERHLPAETS